MMNRTRMTFFVLPVFIIGYLCIVASSMADEASPNPTRIIIAASGPIKYKVYQKDIPPYLEIKFMSKNIFARIQKEGPIGQGIIKEVHTAYYRKRRKEKMPPIKSLTFYLRKKAPYRIIEEGNMVIVEIETPQRAQVQEPSFSKVETFEITRPLSLDKKEQAFLKSLIEGELKLRREERENE